MSLHIPSSRTPFTRTQSTIGSANIATQNLFILGTYTEMEHKPDTIYNALCKVFPPCGFRLKVSVVAS